jgi:class 3 adenylate cyclase
MPDVGQVPETRYARTAAGVHIAYQVVGEGALDLVFIPDWVSHVDTLWDEPHVADILRGLSSFGRLIWFDMRGTGGSDPVPDVVLPTEEWMADVRAVMEAVGSTRAALVGMGHGGQMMMLFAATHPDAVSALVLISSYARLARAPDYPAGMPEHYQNVFLSGIEHGWGTGMTIHLLAPSIASEPGLQAWWGKVERLAQTPGGALAKTKLIFSLDVRDVLPSIHVPTLILHRRDNELFRVGHGHYLRDHIADSKYVELAGADHWPLGDDLMDEIGEFLTGERTHAAVDRVLSTVLFTDIVDSTTRAAALGDAVWNAFLGRHDLTARNQVERHGGRLVKSTGDGILAIFDGPARGIRCATAIRQELRGMGVEIRAGLHTGEIEIRNGDIGGIAVHIAARVEALASAGEVLVSRTVVDLVAGSGIGFEDRGEHDLKGVPGTWRLFAVED